MEDAKRNARAQDASRGVRHALYDLDLPSSDSILAFLEVWDWAGCRPGKLTISAAFVAGLVRLVDARSARRWIEAWAAVGLVTILARDRRRGAYEIFLEDPREIPRVRRHRAEPDLFDDQGDDDEGCADSEPGPGLGAPDSGAHACPPDSEFGGQRRACVSAQTFESGAPVKNVEADQAATINELRAQLAALEARLAENPVAPAQDFLRPIPPSEDLTNGGLGLWPKASRPRGAAPADTGAVLRRSASDLPLKSLGEALVEMFEAKEPPRVIEERQRALVAMIRARVADPRLQVGPCWRAARAVTEGALPIDELERIFCRLDAMRAAGELRGPPFSFFVQCLKTSFADLRIPWERRGSTHTRDPPPGDG